MQLARDAEKIQVKAVSISFITHRAHMSSLFVIRVEIFLFYLEMIIEILPGGGLFIRNLNDVHGSL